ncbi:uncharacterized protein P174DRAFT_199220 [Aspergillus novofumigatus IBT 16806]|uniref:Uncharacterized protein n=1 Tax=Aspergillus novofumigatus (strain IBT 16806) TaxID=1392255 RepID=A0A2I1C486_ASPN1|nr:uncharacterized protein P174DRAFT_199220 [Aspergillus novofumigatus IBT 16806]PKX92428.1 hypothetical protein P174DRAFT_199220 [Aspergillus novofumigatus IBT 16806]
MASWRYYYYPVSTLSAIHSQALHGCTVCRDVALPCDHLLSFIYLKHDIGKSAVIMETSIKASESET